MDLGYATDDQYNVYDKGLFTAQPTLYRPKKDKDGDMHGGVNERLEKILKTDRFKPKRTLWTHFPKIASPKKEGFFGRLRRAHGIFGYVHTIHNFAAEIDGIRRRVNDIKDRRQRYGIEEKSGNDTWDARQSFPHVDEPNVVGFEGHMEKLVGMLNNDSQCGVISITGMAGLGKTTLAKKVYNSVQQSFECSAWICVSQQPNTVELLRDVARQLGLHKDKWEHNVHANLFKFLCDKRYVVVIDDLWKIESWDDLMTGIPNNSKSGGRIILTSRNIEVATVGNSVSKVRRVTTNHECISSFNNYGTPKLRAMLFFNGEDLGVDNFPRDLRLLRVISLECQRVAFPLPSEIGNWSHVTYIQLKVH
ncbi:Disease resistance RPP8-like protein 3 [Camellia lanceoleosa]|uniref:Disease resistance RPP8-like protein 3 n=1 Tax=Camellia lanceoleosa TaxID=1840588 RepID=A0ACC0FE93_9ERIC|nr:Disease resistance RPP8-like protein 3 [Camellia lanceoleosa]